MPIQAVDWSTSKITETFKSPNGRTMVVKGVSGRFFDMTQKWLSRAHGNYPVEEMLHEIVVHEIRNPFRHKA